MDAVPRCPKIGLHFSAPYSGGRLKKRGLMRVRRGLLSVGGELVVVRPNIPIFTPGAVVKTVSYTVDKVLQNNKIYRILMLVIVVSGHILG